MATPKGYTHLTLEQRNHIQLYHGCWTQQAIADSLRVNQSTVSYELSRNRDDAGRYVAETAHQKATTRRADASRMPRKVPPNFLDDCVIPGLDDGRNPKVIAHDLKRTGGPTVSAKWIYALLDREHRHGDPDIAHYLRRKYKKKSPFKRANGAGVHIIPNRIDITKRPTAVESRATFGHWEADTIVGARQQGSIVTLVDRKTRQGFCFHVPHRTKTRVADAIIAMLASRAGAVKTITFDNGGEFADHERIAAALDCQTYFLRATVSIVRPWHQRALQRHAAQLLSETHVLVIDRSRRPRDECRAFEQRPAGDSRFRIAADAVRARNACAEQPAADLTLPK